MLEQKRYTGYWYLPNGEDCKIAGTVVFLPNEKIELELLGHLEPNSSFLDILSDDDRQVDIIYGITSCGKKISLVRCYSFGSFNTGALTPIIKYKCQFLIEGYFLSDIKAKLFDSIKVELPSLSKWYPPEAIKRRAYFNEMGDEILETQITLSKRSNKEETVYLDSEYKITFTGSSSYQEKSKFVSEFLITQQTICKISCYESKVDFISLLDKAFQFKLFLNLATLSSNTFKTLTLIDDDYFQDLRNGEKCIKPIKLFYIEHDKNKDNEIHNYLFTHHQINDVYSQIIRAWFNIGKKYAPIRNHLLASINQKKVWESTDFLIIIQALEGYHRRFINNVADLTLRFRIKELLIKFNEVENLDMTDDEIDHAIKSRNYYSHFFEDKDAVLDGLELYNLAKKLRILLICCILSLLGFNNSKINMLIKKSYSDILK